MKKRGKIIYKLFQNAVHDSVESFDRITKVSYDYSLAGMVKVKLKNKFSGTGIVRVMWLKNFDYYKSFEQPLAEIMECYRQLRTRGVKP